MAMQASIYENGTTVWKGPKATSAELVRSFVIVKFETQPGSGGIAVNVSAACPVQVQPRGIYCTEGGFEVLINGKWVIAPIVFYTSNVVTLQVSGHPSRVRY